MDRQSYISKVDDDASFRKGDSMASVEEIESTDVTGAQIAGNNNYNNDSNNDGNHDLDAGILYDGDINLSSPSLVSSTDEDGSQDVTSPHESDEDPDFDEWLNSEASEISQHELDARGMVCTWILSDDIFANQVRLNK